MQQKTFNRIVIGLMLLVTIVPGIIAAIDFLSPPAAFVGHIVAYLALMAIPVFWVISNLFTFIFYWADRSLATRMFWLQCLVSILFILVALFFVLVSQVSGH